MQQAERELEFVGSQVTPVEIERSAARLSPALASAAVDAAAVAIIDHIDLSGPASSKAGRSSTQNRKS